MDADYSKREIDAQFKAVGTKIDLYHDETMKEIAEQTKVIGGLSVKVGETNGKVAAIQQWKERLIGAAWTGGIVITVVIIPLLTWAFITISKIDERIQKGIETALVPYELPELPKTK